MVEAYDFDVENPRADTKTEKFRSEMVLNLLKFEQTQFHYPWLLMSMVKMRAYVFDINDQKMLYHALV